MVQPEPSTKKIVTPVRSILATPRAGPSVASGVTDDGKAQISALQERLAESDRGRAVAVDKLAAAGDQVTALEAKLAAAVQEKGDAEIKLRAAIDAANAQRKES